MLSSEAMAHLLPRQLHLGPKVRIPMESHNISKILLFVILTIIKILHSQVTVHLLTLLRVHIRKINIHMFTTSVRGHELSSGRVHIHIIIHAWDDCPYIAF